jgi:hypothetical protein
MEEKARADDRRRKQDRKDLIVEGCEELLGEEGGKVTRTTI